MTTRRAKVSLPQQLTNWFFILPHNIHINNSLCFMDIQFIYIFYFLFKQTLFAGNIFSQAGLLFAIKIKLIFYHNSYNSTNCCLMVEVRVICLFIFFYQFPRLFYIIYSFKLIMLLNS